MIERLILLFESNRHTNAPALFFSGSILVVFGIQYLIGLKYIIKKGFVFLSRIRRGHFGISTRRYEVDKRVKKDYLKIAISSIIIGMFLILISYYAMTIEKKENSCPTGTTCNQTIIFD